MDAGRLRAPQQRADVLGILERIEDERERRLAPLDGSGKDVVDSGVYAGLDGKGDPLVTVEASQRGQRPAFDLDDGDPEARRVENESFQRLAALRNDEQAMGRSAGDECLLDRTASGNQLLVVREQIRRWNGRAERGSLANIGLPCAIGWRTVDAGPLNAGPIRAGSILTRTVEAFPAR